MVDHTALSRHLDISAEWLLIRGRGRSFTLTRNEIDIEALPDRTLITFIDDKGSHTRRINSFVLLDDEVEAEVAGAFGKDAERLRLIPRTPASLLTAEVERARLKMANSIAGSVEQSIAGIRLVRVALNSRGGRLAQIIYKDHEKRSYAAISDVTGTMTSEQMLASSMLWSEILSARKDAINNILIICEKRHARELQKLTALLNPHWRSRIDVAELDRKSDPLKFNILAHRRISELWRDKQHKFSLPVSGVASRTAELIQRLAPDKIDIIHAQKGETLRYFGLPFVRTRTMMGKERAWFGTSKEQHPLIPETWDDLVMLTEKIASVRNAAPCSKRHEYYRTASEAWLESILRRDITLLDGNLMLSPIYNQFRSNSDRIDLLALRRDGRLIVIEVKTHPDRGMVFQAANYWRMIELQRRRGDLAAADLFGNAVISDKPAIVYLVAPAWSFHRDHEFFARSIAADIEMWRFELHEDWRREIRVIARNRYSGETNL